MFLSFSQDTDVLDPFDGKLLGNMIVEKNILYNIFQYKYIHVTKYNYIAI